MFWGLDYKQLFTVIIWQDHVMNVWSVNLYLISMRNCLQCIA